MPLATANGFIFNSGGKGEDASAAPVCDEVPEGEVGLSFCADIAFCSI